MRYKLVEGFQYTSSFIAMPINYFGTSEEVGVFLEKNNINCTSNAEIVEENPIKHLENIKFTFKNVWGFPCDISIACIDIKEYIIDVYGKISKVVYFLNIFGLEIDGYITDIDFYNNEIRGNENFKIQDGKVNCILGYVLKDRKIDIALNPSIETYPFIWDIIGDD